MRVEKEYDYLGKEWLNVGGISAVQKGQFLILKKSRISVKYQCMLNELIVKFAYSIFYEFIWAKKQWYIFC